MIVRFFASKTKPSPRLIVPKRDWLDDAEKKSFRLSPEERLREIEKPRHQRSVTAEDDIQSFREQRIIVDLIEKKGINEEKITPLGEYVDHSLKPFAGGLELLSDVPYKKLKKHAQMWSGMRNKDDLARYIYHRAIGQRMRLTRKQLYRKSRDTPIDLSSLLDQWNEAIRPKDQSKATLTQLMDPLSQYRTVLKSLSEAKDVIGLGRLIQYLCSTSHPPDMECYSVYIKALVDSGNYEKAVSMYRRLAKAAVARNVAPLQCTELESFGSFENEQLPAIIVEKWTEDATCDATYLRAMIHAGYWKAALRFFNQLREKESLTIEAIHSLMCLYSNQFHSLSVILKLLQIILQNKLQPTWETYYYVVRVCHARRRFDMVTTVFDQIMQLGLVQSDDSLRVVKECVNCLLKGWNINENQANHLRMLMSIHVRRAFGSNLLQIDLQNCDVDLSLLCARFLDNVNIPVQVVSVPTQRGRIWSKKRKSRFSNSFRAHRRHCRILASIQFWLSVTPNLCPNVRLYRLEKKLKNRLNWVDQEPYLGACLSLCRAFLQSSQTYLFIQFFKKHMFNIPWILCPKEPLQQLILSSKSLTGWTVVLRKAVNELPEVHDWFLHALHRCNDTDLAVALKELHLSRSEKCVANLIVVIMRENRRYSTVQNLCSKLNAIYSTYDDLDLSDNNIQNAILQLPFLTDNMKNAIRKSISLSQWIHICAHSINLQRSEPVSFDSVILWLTPPVDSLCIKYSLAVDYCRRMSPVLAKKFLMQMPKIPFVAGAEVLHRLISLQHINTSEQLCLKMIKTEVRREVESNLSKELFTALFAWKVEKIQTVEDLNRLVDWLQSLLKWESWIDSDSLFDWIIQGAMQVALIESNQNRNQILLLIQKASTVLNQECKPLTQSASLMLQPQSCFFQSHFTLDSRIVDDVALNITMAQNSIISGLLKVASLVRQLKLAAPSVRYIKVLMPHLLSSFDGEYALIQYAKSLFCVRHFTWRRYVHLCRYLMYHTTGLVSKLPIHTPRMQVSLMKILAIRYLRVCDFENLIFVLRNVQDRFAKTHPRLLWPLFVQLTDECLRVNLIKCAILFTAMFKQSCGVRRDTLRLWKRLIQSFKNRGFDQQAQLLTRQCLQQYRIKHKTVHSKHLPNQHPDLVESTNK